MLFEHTRRDFFIATLILSIAAIASFGIVAFAQDHPLDDIIFPIIELGNCGSEDECMAYCDELDHFDECILFAEEHNLLTPEEITEAKKFLELGGVGPGGCTGRDECDLYCEDVTHINECIAFGEEHGLISADELDEARKVAAALNAGVKLPGGCINKDSCEIYCEDPLHIDECVAFAEAAGLVPPDELEEMKKFAEFIKSGGQTPGNCKGEEECEAYCEDESHFEECLDFAAAAGFISPEEVEMIKKTGGKGPGDCRGREECEAFCNDPANQEACFAFAREFDLLSDEDLLRAEEGVQHVGGFSQAPPEVLSCLEQSLGAEVIEKIRSGNFFPTPEVGGVMQSCFEQFSGFGGEDHGGPGGFEPGGFEGGGFEQSKPGIEQAFEQATPTTSGCLSSELGFDTFKQIRDGNFSNLGPEVEAAFRDCFERGKQEFPEGEFLPSETDRSSFPGGFEEGFGQEGGQFSPDGFVPPDGFEPPPDGFVPPDGFEVHDGFVPPDGFEPPPDGFVPPDEFIVPDEFVPHPPPPDGSTSFNFSLMIANVLFFILGAYQ